MPPVAGSQRVTTFSEAEARLVPSGEKATDATWESWSRSAYLVPLARSQSPTVLPPDETVRVFPSVGEKATDQYPRFHDLTSMVAVLVPVVRSHSLTTPRCAEARVLPSGEIATARTGIAGVMLALVSRVPRSHNLTAESADAEASEPSGKKARELSPGSSRVAIWRSERAYSVKPRRAVLPAVSTAQKRIPCTMGSARLELALEGMTPS